MASVDVCSKAVVQLVLVLIRLRNELNLWNVHGIMKTPGLLQSR